MTTIILDGVEDDANDKNPIVNTVSLLEVSPSSNLSSSVNVLLNCSSPFTSTTAQIHSTKDANALSLPHLSALPPYTNTHKTSPEYLEKKEWLFIKDKSEDDVTIIFNVFKGPAVNLERQLEVSLSQKNAKVKEVWVMAFNSPLEEEYGAVIEKIRQSSTNNNKIPIHYTRSSSNYKFHGRFYLAYMATTKYIAMMDDDVPIDKEMMGNFIKESKRKPLQLQGIQGVFRSTSSKSKTKFRVGYNHNIKKDEQLNYLCGFWFFKREWLQAFFRENPLTFTTGEDIHLTHALSKYLDIHTFAKDFSRSGSAKLDGKKYTATKGNMYVIRNEMFRINAGRGNHLGEDTPLDSLVFVPSSKAAVSFFNTYRHYFKNKTSLQSEKDLSSIFSKLGKSSMLFTGRQLRDFKSSSSSNNLDVLKKTADDYCDASSCAYTLHLQWGDKMRPITYHNMHLGLGLEDSEFPLHTLLSDFITTLVSILRNMRRVKVLVVVVDPQLEESRLFANTIDLGMSALGKDRPRPQIYKIELN